MIKLRSGNSNSTLRKDLKKEFLFNFYLVFAQKKTKNKSEMGTYELGISKVK